MHSEIDTKSSDRGYDGYIPIRATNVSIVHVHTGLINAIDQYLNIQLGTQDNNRREQTGINTLQVSRMKDGCWMTTESDGENGGEEEEEEEEEVCANEKRLGSAYNVFIRDRKEELPNLHVVEAAKVVKLTGIEEGYEGDITVEYVQKGWRYSVKAKHEVLLSAGSWGNPKIAMLSGIGDPEVLSNANIDTVIDLPGVGKNFKDHGVLWLTAMLNNIAPVDTTTTTDTTTTATDATIDIGALTGVNQPLPALLAGRI